MNIRLLVATCAAAALTAPASAQLSGQADVAGATPVLVNPDALSTGQLERIRRTLGVASTTKINSTGSEVWQIPDSNVRQAFATAARNQRLSLDYRGEDYRTLFLPVANADLSPATSQALQRVTQDPKFGNVQLVRLRAEEISDRMLKSGFGTADGLPTAGSLLVNVRPGVDILMQRKAIRESGDQLSWSGSAAAFTADAAPTPTIPSPTIPTGDATLVARGDKILGSIRVGADTYSVIPLNDGLHAVAKVNTDAFPPEHPPSSKPSSPVGDAPMADLPAVPSITGPAQVMIGVAFTQAAADAIAANLNVSPDHLAQVVIDLTNLGYQQSGIKSRVQLAGTQLIAGAEKPDYSTMVEAIVNPADGAFDPIHAWRKSVKADAVIMFVSLTAYCGMAADILTPASKAFATVNWSCAKDNLSFPHEFGHLLGARHNFEDDPTDRPFAYGHGYRVQWWRTVMAYPGGICGRCPRLNRWADPSQQYDGIAMGVAATSHDARLLEEMLPVFSAYSR